MRTITSVVMLFVLFVAGAMTQEIPIDAGANVGNEGIQPPAASSQPTIILEAAMADESQPQSQAGPSGPAGESGATGAPGQNGRKGRDGRPGRDSDPREIAKMVLAQLEKTQRGETPAGWAKPYIDALKAEELVVGYSDGTIRPKENVDFERVVVVIGRVQQQLRGEIKAAEERANAYTDKRKKEVEKQMENIGTWVVASLLGIIAGWLIWGRNSGQNQQPQRAPQLRQLGQAAAQDAGAMLEEYGVPGAEDDDVEQGGAQRDYVYDEEGRIVRRAGKRWRSRPRQTGYPTLCPASTCGAGNANALAVVIDAPPEMRGVYDPTSPPSPSVVKTPEGEEILKRLEDQIVQDDEAAARTEHRTRESLKAVVDETAVETEKAKPAAAKPKPTSTRPAATAAKKATPASKS